MNTNPESSNGRTAGFGSADEGSISSSGTDPRAPFVVAYEHYQLRREFNRFAEALEFFADERVKAPAAIYSRDWEDAGSDFYTNGLTAEQQEAVDNL